MLRHDEFEKLVGVLLKRTGHRILSEPSRPGSRGPDFETLSPDGRHVVVEVKHLNWARGIGKSAILQLAGDLERYRQQYAGAEALLVLSEPLTSEAAQALAKATENTGIAVWDGNAVLSQIASQPDLQRVIQSSISSKEHLESKFEELMRDAPGRADELCEKLRGLACGRDTWREYERVCTEILTYVFTPDLAAPDIQSRSDDGLDIIDAVFPIRSNHAPWSLVRAEYRTRFVVAEFKNYCDAIGQAQVESIAQYLWRPAQRFFGLLVSRSAPSSNALAQRRRKWLDEEKCIVFLTDEDLCEMIQLKAAKGQPFDVIDLQLEDFFRSLTP
nr:restriction endonuclease [Variovorax sp. IB41]